MKNFRYHMFLAALFFLLSATMAGKAYAGLMISPQRIVFEGRERSTTVLLMNDDDRPHTYRMSWEMKKADETGQYTNIPLDAKDMHIVPSMVVFSPRQVQIGPNGRQNVRLSLRRPADLPPGEYRGHLLFEALPDEAEERKIADNGSGMSLVVKIGLAFSVPVIVRHGDLPATKIEVGDVSLVQAEDHQHERLHLSLLRQSGVSSVYGQMAVFLQQSGKSEVQIGSLGNIPFYPEQQKRVVDVPLGDNNVPSGSKVRVVYQGSGEFTDKVLAEKTISVTQ